MITSDNAYSFDTLEKSTFLTYSEGEAKKRFKKIVRSYINAELETMSDFYQRNFKSLDEVKHCVEVLNNNTLTEGYSCYKYGLEISDDKTYALFTISKKFSQLKHRDCSEINNTEDYYILLRKISLDEELLESGLVLLDYKQDIEFMLQTL